MKICSKCFVNKIRIKSTDLPGTILSTLHENQIYDTVIKDNVVLICVGVVGYIVLIKKHALPYDALVFIRYKHCINCNDK